MSFLIRQYRTEPVVVMGFLEAVIAAALTFAHFFDVEERIAIMGVITALFSIITRSQVVPVVTLRHRRAHEPHQGQAT